MPVEACKMSTAAKLDVLPHSPTLNYLDLGSCESHAHNTSADQSNSSMPIFDVIVIHSNDIS